MRCKHFFAVLLALVATGFLAADASATYHPTLGRWLQRDPIDYADGMSLYECVGSSPVTARDPDGLQWGNWGIDPNNPPTERGSSKEQATPAGPRKEDPTREKERADLAGKDWILAYFLHSTGTYYHEHYAVGLYVGHSAIGFESTEKDLVVFDYTGEEHGSYNSATPEIWIQTQAQACPKGCTFVVEDLRLKLSGEEANRLGHRLNARKNMDWDWMGSGTVVGEGSDMRVKHNCNSSLCEDMAAITSLVVPSEYYVEMPYHPGAWPDRAPRFPRLWGKDLVPWLRMNGWVESEHSAEYDCTGDR